MTFSTTSRDDVRAKGVAGSALFGTVVDMTETFTDLHALVFPLLPGGDPQALLYLATGAPMILGAGVADGNALFGAHPQPLPDLPTEEFRNVVAELLGAIAEHRVGSARKTVVDSATYLYTCPARAVRGTHADFAVLQRATPTSLHTLVVLPRTDENAGSSQGIAAAVRITVDSDDMDLFNPLFAQLCADAFNTAAACTRKL